MSVNWPKEKELFSWIENDLRNWGRWGKSDQKGTLNFIDSNTNTVIFPINISLIQKDRRLLFPFDRNIPISYNPKKESILFEVNNKFQFCYCKIDSTTNTNQLKFEIMDVDLGSENVAELIKEVLYD